MSAHRSLSELKKISVNATPDALWAAGGNVFSPWCAGLTWVICGCKRPSSVYLGSRPFRPKMLIFWEITSIYLLLSPVKLNLNFNTWLDLTKKKAVKQWFNSMRMSAISVRQRRGENACGGESERMPKRSLRIFKHNWQLSLIMAATCFSTTMVTFITYTFNADTKHSGYDKHSAQMAG